MKNEFWILEGEPIQVSFNTKGVKFYKGGTGILGSPMEAQLRLIGTDGTKKFQISGVRDLEGRVVIGSPEEALEFVRLFSSIETHYLFPDIQYIEPTLANNAPDPGEYTKEYKQRMNLQSPRYKQEGDGFVIERNLVDRAGKLFRATEHVGRDGAYSLLKALIIDEHSPVTYPTYQ